MKLNEEQKKQITDKFSEMNSKESFLELLNLVHSFLNKEAKDTIELSKFNYLINQKNNDSYISFKIPKKKVGEFRTICAPDKNLKQFQTLINLILQAVYTPHKAATGFVIGKSIVDNSMLHTNKNYVYNLDLENFFPSIEKSRVWGRLLVAPFHLGTTPERKIIANAIARLTSIYILENNKIVNEVLPQGAPTSPVLSNAICEKLDIRLSGLAKRFGLNYSRYADDITFSSMHNAFEENGVFSKIYQEDSLFTKELKRIIAEQNFKVNQAKVRLQKRGYKQEVTGLIVNEKVNVSKKYIKQIRHWIYFIERYGMEKAKELFESNYLKNKTLAFKTPDISNVIYGKLMYLKMVRGAEDALYLKLHARFNKAIGIENEIDQLLDVWEKEGVEAAITFYNFRKKSNYFEIIEIIE